MKATRLLIASAVAAMLPLASAVAQSPTSDPATPPAQDSQQGATFESLDKDSDGRISKSEAAANANVTAQFSSYDLNGNGFIERDEVSNANNARTKTPPDKQ